MDFDAFLEYGFWVPVLLWFGLHFWFRNISYVVFMKNVKHPGRVGFLRLCDVFFSLLVSLVTAVVVVWFLKKYGLGEYANYGIVSIVVFLGLAYLMVRRTEFKLTDLFQSAFYLEYRWVNYEIQRKGIAMSEENVRDRAGLSFAHKLHNAEAHRRFWKYVKAMAASKKIPPEMFEVY